MGEAMDKQGDRAIAHEQRQDSMMNSLPAEIEIAPGDSSRSAIPQITALANQIKQIVEDSAHVLDAQRGLGVALDESAWPIVHGSRESADHTTLKQPSRESTQKFYLYNSQEVQEDEEANGLYMGHLLMQNMASEGHSYPDSPKRFLDEAGALVDFKVVDANAVSVITERVSETESRLWTSAIANIIVFRQTIGKPGLERLATYNHGKNFRFHGSYAFVASSSSSNSNSNGTAENGFFTTMEDAIVRFVLRGNDQQGWHIEQTGLQPLPHFVADATETATRGKDHLVGLTLLDDGAIIASSKRGIVMAVRMTEQGGFILRDYLRLESSTKVDKVWVSNSISSSAQSTFIVTQREINRIDFDPASQKLAVVWSTIYGQEEPWYISRLGPGSGSTPTVMTCNGRKLVVITDGALPMKLLWFDVATGNLAASSKVQFGPDSNGNEPSTSEQSVAVNGCQAFVVQNYMGGDRLEEHIACSSARQGSTIRRRLGDYCQSRLDPKVPDDLFPLKTCPVVFGCSAFGAALYEIEEEEDLSGREAGKLASVRRVWTRDDVSCGTSIPLISTNDKSRVVYCSGLKKGSTQWSLIGLDLDTGADRTLLQFYDYNLAHNALSNPFYAGVEATGPDMMTIGSVGGILHLSPENPTTKEAGTFFKALSSSSGSSGASSSNPDGCSTSSQLRLLENGVGRLHHTRAKFSVSGFRMKGYEGAMNALFYIAIAVGVILALGHFFRIRGRKPLSPGMPK